jgi:magnesium transporter
MANETTTVGEIMKTDLVSITADADQEEAARIIRDYDLIALPVIDSSQRLVGIVTHDDAVDIVEEEAQEDIEKMAGLTGHDEEGDYDYLAEPVMRQVRRRAPVMCLLALFWIVTATVIQGFEEQPTGRALIVALLPMVMATGGMVGTQASALVIRALTVGDIASKSMRLVLWKEVRVAGLMALVLAVIAFVNAMLVSRFEQQPDAIDIVTRSGIVIGAAMLGHVLSAALLGAVTPLVVQKLRGDPAMISTPAVTAIADLTGATIYLILVMMLL